MLSLSLVVILMTLHHVLSVAYDTFENNMLKYSLLLMILMTHSLAYDTVDLNEMLNNIFSLAYDTIELNNVQNNMNNMLGTCSSPLMLRPEFITV